MLNVEATGTTLTENFAMTPAASVCGFYLAHPELGISMSARLATIRCKTSRGDAGVKRLKDSFKPMKTFLNSGATGKIRLGDVLVQQRLISQEQLQKALEAQRTTGKNWSFAGGSGGVERGIVGWRWRVVADSVEL